MIQFSKQQKIDAYRLLSPQEKETVFSESIGDKIALVAMKYGLDETSATRFRFSIGLYLLKLIPKEKLPEVFGERLTGQPIDEIIQDVEAIVFPEIERVKNEYKPEPEEDEEGSEESSNQSSQKTDMLLETPSNILLENRNKPSIMDLERENLLKEIEDPIIVPKVENSQKNTYPKPTLPTIETMPTETMLEARMKGIVTTPKENKTVVADTPKTTPKYSGTDPYREPLE